MKTTHIIRNLFMEFKSISYSILAIEYLERAKSRMSRIRIIGEIDEFEFILEIKPMIESV